MTNSISRNQPNKKGKEDLLNEIIDDLMATCDSILALYIADWEGLSFASKLPLDVNEELISATTLFTLEGAEATRKELEKSLLGGQISYLILRTETPKGPAYMMVFPIENLGYISCVFNKQEDMGIIIRNMKTASNKVKEILFGPISTTTAPTTKKIQIEQTSSVTESTLDELKQELDNRDVYLKHVAGSKYDSLLKRLRTLKDMAESRNK